MLPAGYKTLIIVITAIVTIQVSPCRAQITVFEKALCKLELNYDSNFYYLPFDEKSVVTYLVEPGFEVGLETAKSRFAAQYLLSANYYDQAGEDDFYGHESLLLGEIELTDRTAFKIRDSFIRTRDPAHLDPIGFAASREKYSQNRLGFSLSYHFEPKFTVEAGYQNWITDYDSSLLEDAVGNQGAIDLIYHLNRSSALDLGYQYWDMDYDGTTPDYVSNLMSLKYRKEWRLVTLEAGLGYHNREYSAPGVKNSNTSTYSLLLEGGSRSGKTRYSLAGEQNYNYLGFHSNDFYKAYRFTAKLDHDWTVRITSGLGFTFQSNDYVHSLREDEIRKVEGNAGYLIRDWLELVLSLSNEERRSNSGARNYDRLIALIALQIDYDIGGR